LPEDFKNRIQAIPIATNSDLDDVITWNGATSGLYTAKLAYRCLVLRSRAVNNETKWSWLMKLKGQEKVKFFTCLDFHNQLPTKLLLYDPRLVSSPVCSRCNQRDEDGFHCIQNCVMSRKIWSDVGLDNAVQIDCDSHANWIMQLGGNEEGLLFISM